MADLQWNGINDNSDTGEAVEAKLNTSFSSAELAITAVEESITTINDSISTVAVLDGQTTPTYSLTTVAQDVANYTTGYAGIFMSLSEVTGTIVPAKTGWYQVTYTGDISFDSTANTRFVTLSLNDGTSLIASSIINIPRDAERDSESLSMIMYLTASTGYNIEISSNVNIDITFNVMQFTVRRVG